MVFTTYFTHYSVCTILDMQHVYFLGCIYVIWLLVRLYVPHHSQPSITTEPLNLYWDPAFRWSR